MKTGLGARAKEDGPPGVNPSILCDGVDRVDTAKRVVRDSPREMKIVWMWMSLFQRWIGEGMMVLGVDSSCGYLLVLQNDHVPRVEYEGPRLEQT